MRSPSNPAHFSLAAVQPPMWLSVTVPVRGLLVTTARRPDILARVPESVARENAVLPLAEEPAPTLGNPPRPEDMQIIRLADCIECGLCISACPIALTTPTYLGPAVLAGAQQHGLDGNRSLLALVDSQDGVWRCHSAFECSAVCPSNVDPARRIMDLRKQVIRARIMSFFRRD